MSPLNVPPRSSHPGVQEGVSGRGSVPSNHALRLRQFVGPAARDKPRVWVTAGVVMAVRRPSWRDIAAHPVIEPPQVLINVCINPSLSLEVR